MSIHNTINTVCFFLVFTLFTCNNQQTDSPDQILSPQVQNSGIQLVILGNVQDGGSPHISCKKKCCSELFINPDPTRKVVSIGVVDFDHKQSYLFEASPDMPEQLEILNQIADFSDDIIPNGVFLTHAHIGHYTGLMYFGKEAMNADNAQVYCMDRMKSFLSNNGPWSQLVNLNNI